MPLSDWARILTLAYIGFNGFYSWRFQAASAVAPPFSFATQTAPKVFNHGFQAAFGLSLNAGAMFGSLKSRPRAPTACPQAVRC